MNTFDRFADRVADHVAHAWFFIWCLGLVIIWVPSILIVPDKVPGKLDTWQLIINTTTTIVTFLLVALLHNTQHRQGKATNQRFEELMRVIEGAQDPVEDEGQKET